MSLLLRFLHESACMRNTHCAATHTQTGASQVNVSIGDALVVVTRSPWHLSVYDNASKQLVLDEVGDEEHGLVSALRHYELFHVAS